MMRKVTSFRARRAPALLLIPCLLALGVLAAVADLRETDTESGTVRAEALRAPELRQAQPASLAPAVLLAVVSSPLPEFTGSFEAPPRSAAQAPRAQRLPTHHSRAPPAS